MELAFPPQLHSCSNARLHCLEPGRCSLSIAGAMESVQDNFVSMIVDRLQALEQGSS